jgi:DNA-binding IclR family transcriptional regulator
VKRDVSQVKSLVRALTVVEALAEYPAGVTVTQLAAGLQLPKSSVFRVLYTFAQLGYVQQDPLTERYALGTGFLRLAASVEAGSDIRQVARPFLRELRDATDETVHLAVPVGAAMVYIDKVEGNSMLRLASRVGQQMSMHCCALGKAYLAAFGADERDRMIDELDLVARTRRTITDPAVLRDELQRCHQRGFAVDDQENENGVRCVGVPVVDRTGRPVAALSVSAPAARLTRAAIQDVGEKARRAADVISAALGAKPA